VSNVLDVPIPMIGTIGASACLGESERVSMRHSLAKAHENSSARHVLTIGI
jgi:hypothetical protein